MRWCTERLSSGSDGAAGTGDDGSGEWAGCATGDQLAGNATAKPQVDASEEEMRIEKQRMQYIVGIMAAFCGLLILGIISLIRRYRSQNLK